MIPGSPNYSTPKFPERQAPAFWESPKFTSWRNLSV
jgi:hypothetical protein